MTGLRGLAACLVRAHHLYLHLAIDQQLSVFQHLLRKGYLGVDRFFVISGVVLHRVYGAWFDGRHAFRPLEYLRFVSRRVARLWPMHAAALVIILLSVETGIGAPFSVRLIVANFAMVQGWGISAEINTPAWSVSTEFMAYLLFPFIAGICARSRWGTLACAALAVAALITCVTQAPPLGPARRGWLDIYFNYSPLPLLRCLGGFVIGMLAWRAGQVPALRRLASTWFFGPAVLLLFAWAMLGRVNDMITLCLLPPLVAGLYHGRGPVHAALGAAPMHALGLLSYGIYLIHYPLLNLFPFALGPVRFMLALYLLTAVTSAAALYHFIEQPGRHLIRHLADRMLSGVGRALAARRATPLRDGAP